MSAQHVFDKRICAAMPLAVAQAPGRRRRLTAPEQLSKRSSDGGDEVVRREHHCTVAARAPARHIRCTPCTGVCVGWSCTSRSMHAHNNAMVGAPEGRPQPLLLRATSLPSGRRHGRGLNTPRARQLLHAPCMPASQACAAELSHIWQARVSRSRSEG